VDKHVRECGCVVHASMIFSGVFHRGGLRHHRDGQTRVACTAILTTPAPPFPVTSPSNPRPPGIINKTPCVVVVVVWQKATPIHAIFMVFGLRRRRRRPHQISTDFPPVTHPAQRCRTCPPSPSFSSSEFGRRCLVLFLGIRRSGHRRPWHEAIQHDLVQVILGLLHEN
jgi:hypothetical protein